MSSHNYSNSSRGVTDPTPSASGFCFIYYSIENFNQDADTNRRLATESYLKHSLLKQNETILRFAYLLRYESCADQNKRLIKFKKFEEALEHTDTQGRGVIMKLNHDLKITQAPVKKVIDQFDPELVAILYHLDWVKLFNQEPVLNKKYEWRGFLSPENRELITAVAKNSIAIANKYLSTNPHRKTSFFGSHYDKQNEARALLLVAETFLQACPRDMADRRKAYIKFVEEFIEVARKLTEEDPLSKILEEQVLPALRASINKTCSARPVGGGAYIASLVAPVKDILDAQEFMNDSEEFYNLSWRT